MKVYGYCRTSTPKQKIERQQYNIKAEYPNAVLFSEAYTGTKINRPEFDKLLKSVKTGDTIVFDSVSRMSRTAVEGFQLYEKLYNEGIDLIFLKEHHIDTEVYRNALKTQLSSTGNEVADAIIQGINNALMIIARQQIEIAFEQAQAEVEHIHQLTSDGIVRAKANGKQIGRSVGTEIKQQKEAYAKEVIKQYSKDFNGALNDNEVMGILSTKIYDHKAQNGQITKKSLKLARNTYYKYKSDMKE